MARKKIPLKNWLIPRLRKISLIWQGKTIARDNAKVTVQEGFFKNGKPKFKTKFKCASCQNVFDREETHMDHANPVVDISGFTNWDDYINSLFCDESNYQCLCISCHDTKTQSENKQRREIKKTIDKKKKV